MENPKSHLEFAFDFSEVGTWVFKLSRKNGKSVA